MEVIEGSVSTSTVRDSNKDTFQKPMTLKDKLRDKLKSKSEKVANKETKGHQMDSCDECHKSELVINHVEGTIVCTGCGLVQQNRIIDETSEWRNFSSETAGSGTNQNRVGGKLNPYLSNYGIDTQVKGQNASEIQKWSDRSNLNAKDKLIQKGLRAIKDFSQNLNLKEMTIHRANELYKKIEDDGVLKGKSVDAKVAAVIFVASRLENQARNIKQILQVTQAKQKELNTCYKKIKEIIPDLKVSLDAAQLADQCCNKLGLPMDVNNASKWIAKKITELEIAQGRQPQTIAGVAVFIASSLSVDKRPVSCIAEAVQITEQTIKQAYKEIYEYRNEIIPVWWKHKEPVESLSKP